MPLPFATFIHPAVYTWELIALVLILNVYDITLLYYLQIILGSLVKRNTPSLNYS